MVSVVLNLPSNKTNKIPRFYDTAIPQPEETEVLTGLLQTDGSETCAEAIATFAIGIFFLGRMLSHELYAVEAVFWPAGGAMPESQSCCQAS